MNEDFDEEFKRRLKGSSVEEIWLEIMGLDCWATIRTSLLQRVGTEDGVRSQSYRAALAVAGGRRINLRLEDPDYDETLELGQYEYAQISSHSIYAYDNERDIEISINVDDSSGLWLTDMDTRGWVYAVIWSPMNKE